RRRHTRFSRDWSSDVCSSDLIRKVVTGILAPVFRWLYNNIIKPVWNNIRSQIDRAWSIIKRVFSAIRDFLARTLGPAFTRLRSRSEERRVGKAGRPAR